MDKLRKMQLCELEMLKEVDRIAEKYNLSYNLAYGTFLGAVRHKGFIPWDDDLDISMPLWDFRKFEKICNSELDKKYFLQTPKTDNAPFPFYKIRANNTLMLDVALRDVKMHHGIWIDIFPYVFSAKSEVGKELQIFSLKMLGRIRGRYYYKNTKNLIRKLLLIIPKWVFNIIDKFLLKVIELLGSEKSGYYFELSKYNKVEDAFINIDTLKNRNKYEFEQGQYWGPRDYDFYLKKFYGENYMTPVKYSHISNFENVKFFDDEE